MKTELKNSSKHPTNEPKHTTDNTEKRNRINKPKNQRQNPSLTYETNT